MQASNLHSENVIFVRVLTNIKIYNSKTTRVLNAYVYYYTVPFVSSIETLIPFMEFILLIALIILV